MPKSSRTSSKVPKTPKKEPAAKNPSSKTSREKRVQDVAGAGSSTDSAAGMTPKKEAIAWRRVCETVQKCQNEDPETFAGHPDWLVVGVLRTDGALKVFIPKPQGKYTEFTYCFLSGDTRNTTARCNVDLYSRYITEGVDLVNKPEKQSKEINYLIWKDLCRLWPDDEEVKEHERVLETTLRTKQIYSRATSTPPVTIDLSNTPPPDTGKKHPDHKTKHRFAKSNQALASTTNVDGVTDGLLEGLRRREPVDLYSSLNPLQNKEVLEIERMGQGTMPEFAEDLLSVIAQESKLKGISRTETTRWKALQSLLSQPPDVDVEIAPFPLQKMQDFSEKKMKPWDVSTSKNGKDIIDEYLDGGFPSKALLLEIDDVNYPAYVDQPTYVSFCGRLTKDIPEVIHDASEWKAFHLVSVAVAKEINCGEVDILWLVCTFHETRKMSRHNFMSMAKRYHERTPLLGATNPLVLEGLALAYYQTTGFFLDAVNDAERICDVFESGHETDLILEIASAKTETDLCNLLRHFKKVTMAQFSSLLRSACARTGQTDQLVIRTWRTVDPDLKLLLDALRKHHIKPFGEIAASIQQKATPEAL